MLIEIHHGKWQSSDNKEWRKQAYIIVGGGMTFLMTSMVKCLGRRHSAWCFNCILKAGDRKENILISSSGRNDGITASGGSTGEKQRRRNVVGGACETAINHIPIFTQPSSVSNNVAHTKNGIKAVSMSITNKESTGYSCIWAVLQEKASYMKFALYLRELCEVE